MWPSMWSTKHDQQCQQYVWACMANNMVNMAKMVNIANNMVDMAKMVNMANNMIHTANNMVHVA